MGRRVGAVATDMRLVGIVLVVVAVAACTHEPRQPASPAPSPSDPVSVPEPVFVPTPSPSAFPVPTVSCVDFAVPCGLTRGARFAPAGAIGLPIDRAGFSRMHVRRELVGVALAGDQLFVTVDYCPQCAALQRMTSVADVSKVSEAELGNLQQWMGLPATPLLRSGAAWRQAFGL